MISMWNQLTWDEKAPADGDNVNNMCRSERKENNFLRCQWWMTRINMYDENQNKYVRSILQEDFLKNCDADPDSQHSDR